MPVLLTEEDFEPWLGGAAGREFSSGGRGLVAAMAGVKARQQLTGTRRRLDADRPHFCVRNGNV